MILVNGDQSTIDYALYGWNEERSNYFKENLGRVYEKVRDTGSNIYKGMTDVFNRYHDSNVIKRAKSLLRRENAIGINENEYMVYTDPRLANRRMRDYIMSHHEVSEKYERGILDGYSETDTKYDKTLAILHRALANDGIYRDDGSVTRYWLVDGVDIEDERLSIDEQHDIHITWSSVSRMLANDMDPTYKI